MILLIVDTQKLITTPDLYNFDLFTTNIEILLKEARKNNIEVIYVRHDDGINAPLTKGTVGYEIYERFSPIKNERIFDKNVNSAFNGTGLLEYLSSQEVETIIVVGLQTDYCIDATVKCGFEHGFNIIIPQNANSTIDNQYMSAENTYHYFNDFIWPNRFAKCISLEETIALMNNYNLVH